MLKPEAVFRQHSRYRAPTLEQQFGFAADEERNNFQQMTSARDAERHPPRLANRLHEGDSQGVGDGVRRPWRTSSAGSCYVPHPQRTRTAAQESARDTGSADEKRLPVSASELAGGRHRALRRMARAARTPLGRTTHAGDVVTYSLSVATAKAEETRERILDAA